MDNSIKTSTQIDILDLQMSDEEILSLIQERKALSMGYNDVIKEGDLNTKYYKGTIVNDKFQVLQDYNVNDNRIYISCKTIIPMVTSKPAEPVVYAAKPGDEKSEELALNHQKLLKAIYESKNIQAITEKIALHNLLYSVGFLFYGIRDGDIYSTYIHPSKIIIDMEATCVDDAQFIGIKSSDTAENLTKKFPNKKSEIEKKVDYKMGTKCEYIEWFTDDYVVVSFDDIVLKKMKNPHFNFDGKETTDPETGEVYTVYNSKNNFFKHPKKPFLILNIENDGTSIIDFTSPVTQARPLQDNINRIKRMISINVDKSGNPIKIAQGLSVEQIGEITNNLESGDTIGLSQEQTLTYLQAAPLPGFVSEDLNHSITEIDNIFGTHGTTRGEREARETASGRQILRQGDEDVQAQRGRAIERLLSDLYNAWTQLIKVHFTEKELSYVLGDRGAKELIKAKSSSIEDGIQIRVLAGSTIPDDKVTKMNRALQLAQLGLFPREHLFKELGYENYREIAQALDEQDAVAQIRQQEILMQEQEMKQNEEMGNQMFQQLQSEIQNMQ